MQRLTRNLFVETGMRGANHGFVVTADGIVLIDTPHKPSDALKLKAEIARHGPLRYILNTEPHGDHWTGNAYFDAPVIAHAGVRRRILETNMEEHVARVGGFGPQEPELLQGYRPNAPVITFETGMTLHVGNHSFECIHMPGHTAYQTAICIKEEGVVFTSDNVFHKCHTWLQEANPDAWLDSIEALRELDEDVLVPGHGAVCGKDYLDEQSSFIQEWKHYVQSAIDRGMTRQEAVDRLTAMTDRYPMDIEQDGMAPLVMKRNVANLYDYLTGNWQPL
jgi:glyoxylase-like metal-dependent hydrolase (beta-lactamase superfamily II)